MAPPATRYPARGKSPQHERPRRNGPEETFSTAQAGSTIRSRRSDLWPLTRACHRPRRREATGEEGAPLSGARTVGVDSRGGGPTLTPVPRGAPVKELRDPLVNTAGTL